MMIIIVMIVGVKGLNKEMVRILIIKIMLGWLFTNYDGWYPMVKEFNEQLDRLEYSDWWRIDL